MLSELPVAEIPHALLPVIYLAIAIAPLVVFAILIHLSERVITLRLSSRFGWHSVLWTGWLGTPIHELSHAVMCLVFRMPIEKIALFEPDRNSGCLGYVIYRHEKGNWVQDIGTVFVATAPLVGGTLSILGLLFLFYPDVAQSALFTASGGDLVSAVGTSVQELVTGLFHVDHILTIKLWLFVYLVICIGSHMAPSFTDYHGGMKGSIVVLAALLVISFGIAIFVSDSRTFVDAIQPFVASLLTVLVAVIALCAIAVTVVLAITGVYDRLVK